MTPRSGAPLERSDCKHQLKTSTAQARGQDNSVGHVETPLSFRLWDSPGDSLPPENTLA